MNMQLNSDNCCVNILSAREMLISPFCCAFIFVQTRKIATFVYRRIYQAAEETGGGLFYCFGLCLVFSWEI